MQVFTQASSLPDIPHAGTGLTVTPAKGCLCWPCRNTLIPARNACKASLTAHTLMRSLPVPRIKPASVFPMPVANWPNAPALQVCESVPKSTSPAMAHCACQYCCTAFVRISAILITSIVKQTPTESSHAYLLLHNLAPLKCSSTWRQGHTVPLCFSQNE